MLTPPDLDRTPAACPRVPASPWLPESLSTQVGRSRTLRVPGLGCLRPEAPLGGAGGKPRAGHPAPRGLTRTSKGHLPGPCLRRMEEESLTLFPAPGPLPPEANSTMRLGRAAEDV